MAHRFIGSATLPSPSTLPSTVVSSKKLLVEGISRRIAAKAGIAPPLIVRDEKAWLEGNGTKKNSSITYSTSFACTHTEKELEAAIAHEISHIKKNHPARASRVKKIVAYLNGNRMLDNVSWSLHIYHAAVRLCRAQEFSADRHSITLTGDAESLISALRKYPSAESAEHPPVEERIARLQAL